MIITNLESLRQYYGINVFLSKIPDFLRQHETLDAGKYDIGDDCYVNILQYETKDDDGKYEAHRQYLDVQIMLEGEEIVYVKDIADGKANGEYDESKDTQFFSVESAQSVTLQKGTAVILLPHDLHRPSIKIGEIKQVKKAVFKIKI